MHTIDTPTAGGLMTKREGAAYLSVSERTMYSLTQPRGPIPAVRVTAWAVRYDRADLDAYIAARRGTAEGVGDETTEGDGDGAQ